MKTTDEDWYDAYDLLVMSVVRTVREVDNYLQASDGGPIVNITTRTVKQAVDQMVLSNSVRMGGIVLEKTISAELAADLRANGPPRISRDRPYSGSHRAGRRAW